MSWVHGHCLHYLLGSCCLVIIYGADVASLSTSSLVLAWSLLWCYGSCSLVMTSLLCMVIALCWVFICCSSLVELGNYLLTSLYVSTLSSGLSRYCLVIAHCWLFGYCLIIIVVLWCLLTGCHLALLMVLAATLWFWTLYCCLHWSPSWSWDRCSLVADLLLFDRPHGAEMAALLLCGSSGGLGCRISPLSCVR